MNDFVKELKKMEEARLSSLPDISGAVKITDYSPDGNGMWTSAFDQALKENAVLRVPASDTPYMIDGSIIVPSGRTMNLPLSAVVKPSAMTPMLPDSAAMTAFLLSS